MRKLTHPVSTKNTETTTSYTIVFKNGVANKFDNATTGKKILKIDTPFYNMEIIEGQIKTNSPVKDNTKDNSIKLKSVSRLRKNRYITIDRERKTIMPSKSENVSTVVYKHSMDSFLNCICDILQDLGLPDKIHIIHKHSFKDVIAPEIIIPGCSLTFTSRGGLKERYFHGWHNGKTRYFRSYPIANGMSIDAFITSTGKFIYDIKIDTRTCKEWYQAVKFYKDNLYKKEYLN